MSWADSEQASYVSQSHRKRFRKLWYAVFGLFFVFVNEQVQ